MTSLLRYTAFAAIASLLLSGAAFAQTPTPTPAPMAKPAAAEKSAEVPHTAASLECSKQADAKGLHGKERKKFRSECRKGAEKPK